MQETFKIESLSYYYYYCRFFYNERSNKFASFFESNMSRKQFYKNIIA